MSGTGMPQPPETAAPEATAPAGVAPQSTAPNSTAPNSTAPNSTARPEVVPVPQPRTLTPLDPPMLPFALGGVGVWLVALLIVLPLRDSHESWFWICVAGLLWGVPGTLTMIRHDARRRRRNQDQL